MSRFRGKRVSRERSWDVRFERTGVSEGERVGSRRMSSVIWDKVVLVRRDRDVNRSSGVINGYILVSILEAL